MDRTAQDQAEFRGNWNAVTSDSRRRMIRDQAQRDGDYALWLEHADEYDEWCPQG